jgi:hypothetical protein
MTARDSLKTHQGRILYSELPEEYRYRDNPTEDEFGDLEAYLHGFGHLLDLIRGTVEQAHADSFAEVLDDGKQIQPWLIPYLADLVGAELMSPAPDERIDELNASVGWSKAKGTLATVDSIADIMSDAETVTREGWRSTLTCPRPSLPPFTAPKSVAPSPAHPGCPDLSRLDRAAQDPRGLNPLNRLRYPTRTDEGHPGDPDTLYFESLAPGGAPAFPGHYDDASVRCPDLRSPSQTRDLGPHPRRSHVFLRPPDGLFEAGLKEIDLGDPTTIGIDANATAEITPASVYATLGLDGPAPDRIRLKLSADLDIPAGSEITFRDILLVGAVPQGGGTRLPRIRVAPDAQLILRRAAAPVVTLAATEIDPDRPSLDAIDSLIEDITGPSAMAQLVYVTVMGTADLKRLNASDCILNDLSSNITCGEGESCVRYSRLVITGQNPGRTCFDALGTHNTQVDPVFARRYARPAPTERCRLTLPAYGEPGYGVLALHAPAAIAMGAEDEGEMGAHHHLYLCARVHALARKLTNYLPVGQEVHLVYDPLLILRPPEQVKQS